MEFERPDDGHVGRRHPTSGVHIHPGEPTIVFVTAVTRDRGRWLTQPLVHECLREAWWEAQAWLVGFYLLMPDHLHLFCAPRDHNLTLDAWVMYWKSQFKKKLNARIGRVRLPPNPDLKKTSTDVPQSRFYTEADEEFQRKWIRNSQMIGMANKGDSEGGASLPALIGKPADYRWQEGKPWDTRLRRWENYEQKWR
jgi:REP element-mobilizing transposase RayT